MITSYNYCDNIILAYLIARLKEFWRLTCGQYNVMIVRTSFDIKQLHVFQLRYTSKNVSMIGDSFYKFNDNSCKTLILLN